MDIYNQPLERLLPEKPYLKDNLLKGLRRKLTMLGILGVHAPLLFKHLDQAVKENLIWGMNGVGMASIEWTLGEYNRILKEEGLL